MKRVGLRRVCPCLSALLRSWLIALAKSERILQRLPPKQRAEIQAHLHKLQQGLQIW